MNMTNIKTSPQPAPDAIAIHLLRALTRASVRQERVHLEDLAREIGVRRRDARRVLTTLDRQGYVDVLRMRPTLLGFALGHAVSNVELVELRTRRSAPALAA